MKRCLALLLICIAHVAFAENLPDFKRIEKKNRDWDIYEAVFGDEQVIVRFPEDPTRTIIGQRLYTILAEASKGIISVTFKSFYPALIADCHDWFNLLVSEYPYNLISSDITKTEEGYLQMDFKLQSRKDRHFRYGRAVATPINCYLLYYENTSNKTDRKDHFFNSLKITPLN